MREPTEMELRVAKAIIDSGIRGDLADDEWTLLASRVAIRAMRSPTEDILEAGAKAHPDDKMYERCWNAMIDAASPPA